MSSQYDSIDICISDCGSCLIVHLKCVLYASCTVYENDNERPLSAAGDLSRALFVSLTLITTACRSPLERFGLNVSC